MLVLLHRFMPVHLVYILHRISFYHAFWLLHRLLLLKTIIVGSVASKIKSTLKISLPLLRFYSKTIPSARENTTQWHAIWSRSAVHAPISRPTTWLFCRLISLFFTSPCHHHRNSSISYWDKHLRNRTLGVGIRTHWPPCRDRCEQLWLYSSFEIALLLLMMSVVRQPSNDLLKKRKISFFAIVKKNQP